VWSVLKFAARSAIWRTTPDPPRVGLPTLVGWTLVLAVVRGVLQLLDAMPSPAFNPYGLNALVAWLVVALAVAAFFVRPAARATFLSAMVALSVLTEAVLSAIRLGLTHILPSSSPLDVVLSTFPAFGNHWTSQWLEAALSISFFLAPVVSWIGGMFAIIRSIEPHARLRLLGRVIALWAALFIAKGLVPHTPVFAGAGFDARNANWWEYAHAEYVARRERKADPDIRTARLQNLQPALLQAAAGRLAPQRKGETDIYAIGIAGFSGEDVFVKEVDGAFAALERSLPIKDRALRLLNDPETVEKTPLASRRNFADAVHAVAGVMDKDEDVLILLMTSHGGPGGIALQLPGGGQAVLGAREVKKTLDGEGIRNRVVIVSACYGGVFVAPLASDDAIILTAADAQHTSFGCAAGRDWTYFGDALFKQSLRPGMDFQRAFDHARILIRSWETLDRLPPSNPQGHFGPAVVAKLDPVFKAMAGQ
jgi:Peptidase C13 family